jgi:hypothetical protein
MPSFFIIAFIWRGLIFPGSIFLTTLPYFYRYSVIKCQHLRAGNDRCSAGDKPIFPGDYQDVIARADNGICADNVFCKRILPLCHEPGNILPDNNPVPGCRKERLEALCSFNAKRQPAI